MRSNLLVFDRMVSQIGTEKGVKDWVSYERLKVSQGLGLV